MDARQGGELLVPQGHIVIQVGRDDAEQVVGVAEQPLGVADLRYRDERGFESFNGAGVLAVHRDADEGLETEADRGRVQDGAVAGDDAVALELAQPPVTGRRSEPHPVGQLCHRQAAVLLEFSKNHAINLVHTHRIFQY